MAKSLRDMLMELRQEVDGMVDALLSCENADLDKPLDLDFDGKKFKTDLRAVTRYTIEEYRVHEGQIGGNQYNTQMVRNMKTDGDIDAFTPYDRTDAAWLAAELYVAAAMLIARCLGYPEKYVDDRPREGEWSVREVVQHLLQVEQSKQWSMKQFVDMAKGK